MNSDTQQASKTFGPIPYDWKAALPGTNYISLRDYFAGQALIGILLTPGQLGSAAQNNPDQAALWAYRQADAMLAARERKGGTK